MRLGLLGGTIALVCAAMPSAATSAADEPVLTGRTTFVGVAQASREFVSLPSPVTVGPGCLLAESAVFAGSARHTAIFLTQVPLTPDSPIHWVVRTTGADGKARVADSTCASGATLASGRYLLQHVHTPGSSEISLDLPGLEGQSEIAIRGADPSRMEALPVVLDTAGRSATYAWGARHDLVSQGSVLTIGMLAGGASDRGQGAFGDCLLNDSMSSLPDPVAYAPGCPAGSSGTGQGAVGTETWQATITSNLRPGSYGAGFWYATTPTSKPLGAASVWLSNLS
jgi:hypothetical protein